MTRVRLPESITLKCPSCSTAFELDSRYLAKAGTVNCPLCSSKVELFAALAPRIRKQIYGALRAHIEARVYEQKQLDSDIYSEDEQTLGPDTISTSHP